MSKAQHVDKSAILSADGKHRYFLDRVWDRSLPVLVFIMLNPSIADASRDDPTIGRCRSFAEENDCGAVAVFNLFSMRSPYPEDLWRSVNPVRAQNDTAMLDHLSRLDVGSVVAAWGSNKHPRVKERAIEVRTKVHDAGFRMKCLDVTLSGAPKHPLYIRAGTPLIDWDYA